MMLVLTDDVRGRDTARLRIKSGDVVAFRTDTFYGLGVDPFNSEAIKKLNELKGRDGKPILLIISDRECANRFISHTTRLFDILTKAFWPGALTVVAEADKSVPDELTAGSGKIGVRLPEDESVREFVRLCGGALTATSANTAGGAPSSNRAEVEAYFGETNLLLIDGGEATSHEPSTVVDVSSEKALLIREGVVKAEELRRALLPFGAELE